MRFDPIDAIIDVNQPLTIDARCTSGGEGLEYIFDLGDGRVKRGQPFITAVWTQPGNLHDGSHGAQAGRLERSRALRRASIDEDVLTRAIRVRSPFVAAYGGLHLERLRLR